MAPWSSFQIIVRFNRTLMTGRRFFVAERRFDLRPGVLTPVSCVREIRESPQRRLNVATNSQQSKSSLRDWIIIRPLNRR